MTTQLGSAPALRAEGPTSRLYELEHLPTFNSYTSDDPTRGMGPGCMYNYS